MKHSIPALLLLATLACNNSPTDKSAHNEQPSALSKLDALEWIKGTWKAVSPDGVFYETWTVTDDSTWSGRNEMIVNQDTVFSEKISLEQRGGDVLYIPSVSNQNNGQPIPFRLVPGEEGQLVFENKAHDFPQRIVYAHPHPDSLHAWIEGTKDGKFHREDFRMSR